MGVHPAGVLPNGNALLLPSADARALHARKTAGLGALAALDDALLLSVFDRFTHDDDGAKTLAALASTSKACRAFATHEDLWKSLTLNAYGGKFTFRGQSWLATFRAAREARTRKRPREDEKEEKDRRTIQCEIFSDVLHQRYMCAAMDVESEWVAEASTVPEATSTMSVDEFREKYESLNIPVVIRGAAKNWPAMKKWTRQALVRKFEAGGGPGAAAYSPLFGAACVLPAHAERVHRVRLAQVELSLATSSCSGGSSSSAPAAPS